ncbi:MAG: prepilin peptidase [Clostridiaceae bacterium]|nr:prepilin peptidase [Clostridiaceae bacterium]
MPMIREPATLPLIVLAGLGAGWLLVRLYNHLPESWLQDYGFRAADPDWTPARRIRSKIGTAGVMLLTAAGFMVAALSGGLTLRTLLMALVFCVLVLVAIPDALNKIIPDQAVIALALLGAMGAALDLFEGRGIRDTAVDRIGGAVVAAGTLFLVGFIASLLTKREAMGMGDVKLLFACGLLTGLRLVPLLFFATFVSAAFLAVPMLIRQRKRDASDSVTEAQDVPDPAEQGEDQTSPAEPDESGQAPLGPFIAAACFLCLVAGNAVTDLLFQGLL